jgi:acyl-CoA reductase-like NAD-dependent aldehyde dehydrogenase
MANFFSSGQVCTNGTRVFVPQTLKAAFEQAVIERVKRIRIGDPMQAETNFGPLVSFPHMEKVLSYIESGKQQGATLLTVDNVPLKQRLLRVHMYYRPCSPTVMTTCTLCKMKSLVLS